MSLLVIIALLLLAILGTPLFAVIGASALWNFHNAGIDPQAVAIDFWGLAELPVLLAIPLFTFAGYLLSESGAPDRLVRLTREALGWMPAGLAVVALLTCAFFTAFTGGSGVTIIAIGALLFPALKHAGYTEKFSLGLITSAGSLGLLFAPSLPLILYGVVAEVSIHDMFLAGILPGILLLTAVIAYSIWKNNAIKVPLGDFSWLRWRASVRESIWEIPLPFFVLGGIYSGYFAISEAAAVTALYVIIINVFVLREIPLRQLPRIMRESMTLVGGIMLILGLSLASTNYMIDAGIPQKLLEAISIYVSGRVSFLLLLLVFLLVLGAILDIFSALALVVPLILPVATSFGIQPVHLGIIFLATMELGYLTPPVGLNLFISSYRFERPIMRVYISTLPFFTVLLLSVILITFWPTLSLLLI